MAAGGESAEPRVAIESVFRDAYPVMYRVARVQTDAASAHDAVMDAFTVAWRRRDELDGDVLPWLFVVLRKTLANQRRAAGRRQMLLRKVAAESWSRSHLEQRDRDIDEALFDALDALSPSDREVLVLAYWIDLDNAAIAAVVGTSARVVTTRLHRARGRLATLLANDCAKAAASSVTIGSDPRQPGKGTS